MKEKEVIVKAKIINAPGKPMPKGSYLVARQDITVGHPELWYYGCFKEKERAEEAAVEIRNGVVLEVIDES